MACYEYRCPAGHAHDEYRIPSKRDDPSTCPECGQACQYKFVPPTPDQVFLPSSFRHHTHTTGMAGPGLPRGQNADILGPRRWDSHRYRVGGPD